MDHSIDEHVREDSDDMILHRDEGLGRKCKESKVVSGRQGRRRAEESAELSNVTYVI